MGPKQSPDYRPSTTKGRLEILKQRKYIWWWVWERGSGRQDNQLLKIEMEAWSSQILAKPFFNDDLPFASTPLPSRLDHCRRERKAATSWNHKVSSARCRHRCPWKPKIVSCFTKQGRTSEIATFPPLQLTTDVLITRQEQDKQCLLLLFLF